MEIINYTGPILAFTVFATIGIGHVLVRFLNYHLGTLPGIPFLLSGIASLISSIWISSNLWSSIVGIVGITLFWDGVEFYRQEKRVKKGHAPENPKRPVKRS